MSPSTQLANGLSKLGLYLRSSAWQAAGGEGLTPTQAQALVLIDQRGPLRVGALAELMAVRQPTVTEAVNRLCDKGLLRKQADPADQRATRLLLTAAGRRQARARGEWPDALLGALESLDAEEQAALLRALSKIIEILLLRGEIPPQRMCVSCRYFRPQVHAGARPHHCDFVDAAFGDRELRLDCGDHEASALTPEAMPNRQRTSTALMRRAPGPRQRSRAP